MVNKKKGYRVFQRKAVHIKMNSLKHLLPEKPVILSPMAGFSDSPYRRICRKAGSALSFTEFVSTDNLFRGTVKAIEMFRFTEEERPVIFQVFGNSEMVILKACMRLLPLQPDGIDLNMGCSVKKVAHKGSGAGLLKEPQKVERILSSLVKETGLPISAKIRLGWDENQLNYLDILDAVEQAGCWAISVHGRTRKQRYTGHADWSAIARLKRKAEIPVFGNGDVKSRAEAYQKMSGSGVDAILVGRGAIGNPWLFGDDNKNRLSLAERMPLIAEHLAAMVEFYDLPFGVIMFRKHLLRYLEGIELPDQMRSKLLKLEKPGQVLEQLDEIQHTISRELLLVQ